MLAYEDRGDYFLVITIHTINKQQLKTRLKKGRWIKQ